jgi:1-acyl-sn-glycerol-3-phosphate acyltransferase
MFLNKAGAFSISKGSRSIIESLDYCREILSKRRNLLVIYPQGTIQSAYLKQFKFQKGLERLLTETGQDLQLVFMASLIEYFSERKPRLDIYLCRMPVSGKPSIKKIEAEYNRFFDACRSRQKD